MTNVTAMAEVLTPLCLSLLSYLLMIHRFTRQIVALFFALNLMVSFSDASGLGESIGTASQVLPEPLVSLSLANDKESEELISVLTAFREGLGSIAPLEDFITKHPESSYRASLLVNIGLISYQEGRLSKAVSSWDEAWRLSKNHLSTPSRAVPEKAVSELMRLLGKLGRREDLSNLIDELSGKEVTGSAGELVIHARQALWALVHRPEDSYKCGPYALQTILDDKKGPKTMHPSISDARSTLNGMSLTQVSAIAKKVGLSFERAFRTMPTAELPLPAVLHWKLGHFAAVLRKEGDRYLVKDRTFDDEFWVSKETLLEEGSGYFLLPKMMPGFRSVPKKEGEAIFGKGVPAATGTTELSLSDETINVCTGGGGNLPTASNPSSTAGAPEPGMPRVGIHSMLVSLNVVDSPLWYTSPRGGTQHFTVRYIQRDTKQPQTFTYTNFGPKWTSDSLSFLTDNSTASRTGVSVYLPGGGSETWNAFPVGGNVTNTVDGKYTGDGYTITQVSHAPPLYEKRWYDGRVMVYSYPDRGTTTRRVFLTEERDPQGSKITYHYETVAQGVRLLRVVDPLGQATTLTYGLTADPLKVTGASDPFGRAASFSYTNGVLTGVVDMGGLSSTFTYQGELITAVTTPYGSTSIVRKDSADLSVRSIEVTDPSGQAYRVEYRVSEPGIASLPYQSGTASTYRTDFSEHHNTFIWDRDALRSARLPDGTADIAKALIVNWGKYGARGLRFREKPPLQYGTKYTYPNTDAAPVGRYWEWITPRWDGAGTVKASFTYRTGGSGYSPLITRRAPGEFPSQYAYDPVTNDLTTVMLGAGTARTPVIDYKDFYLRRPRTIIDQQGKTWSLAYNGFGQVTSVTDPRNEITTFTYTTAGYLTSVARGGGTTRYTYDTLGRVSSVTGPDGFVVSYTYDSFDRVKRVTYPDATYEEYTYDKLDLVKVRDREGRFTQYGYNGNRQLISVTDPLSRTTSYTYCGCGKLSSIIDALGHETKYERDIEGKVVKKVYEDGKATTISYYPGTAIVKSITDAKGQVQTFSYDSANRVTKVAYSGTATPAVTTTYWDMYSSRPLKITDGTGTTTFTYPAHTFRGLGAWQVSSIDGPGTNDTLAFTYDDRGGVGGTSLNSATASYIFDSLSRLTKESSSVLGDSVSAYQGATGRPLSRTSVLPAFSENYSYFALPADPRLKDISFVKGGVTSEAYTYGYSATGNITSWSGAYRSGSSVGGYTFGYNAADELTSATASQGTSTLASWSYGYDLAGNRTREDQNGTKRIESSVSVTNALTTQTDRSLPGLTTVGSRSYTHDANGNLTSIVEGGVTTTLVWDAADRLISIKKGSLESRFSYDYMGRWVKIVELNGTTVTSTKDFIWCGLSLCEERSGTQVTRYFSFGFQDPSGAKFYYTRDHLGSVREVRDAGGVVVSRYRYDPYGVRSLVSGSDKSQFGFTGHYLHKTSGLLLAPYRAYSPSLGRWMSRDPIGERGGLNLYGYVGNNTVNLIDPLGLEVRLCKQPSSVCLKQCDHHWLMTDSTEAGLGKCGDGVPGDNYDPPYITLTCINDHSGRHKEEDARCEVVENVDEDCVNQRLRLGTYVGRWVAIVGDCQAFASQAIASCRIPPGPPPVPGPAPK